MQLDYPELEITLVNDRSTDRTGEILDRLAGEFPQLNVVHLSELPGGWLGKNHALQLGASRSRGEWLLFTDADIVFDPSTLRRAITYVNAHQVDHLAATPDCHMPTWLLTCFAVTFAMYFSLFVRIWAVRNPRSTAHIGIGAFNLVRASVYQAVGGHETIRMRPDDDLKLGKIIKLAGYRQDVVNGTGLIGVEWYASVAETCPRAGKEHVRRDGLQRVRDGGYEPDVAAVQCVAFYCGGGGRWAGAVGLWGGLPLAVDAGLALGSRDERALVGRCGVSAGRADAGLYSMANDAA